MKSFYSCIDASFEVPASLQHLCIREMAANCGGKIVFYGSEERKTLKSQAFMRAKLRRLTSVQGICFFSLHQFRYQDSFDWDFLKTILSSGLEVHFCREGLSFLSVEDLERNYVFFFAVDYTLRQEKAQQWVDAVLSSKPQNQEP
jgi:hypothetical protein